MLESTPRFVIAFPGQGSKEYPGNPNPEKTLYNESLDNYERILDLFPLVRRLKPYFFGNSFGQFMADVAVGSITRLEGLELVRARTKIVRSDEDRRVAEDKDRTAMAVLIGHGREVIDGLVERRSGLYKTILDLIGGKHPEDLQISNVNGETNHVVAGDRTFIENLVTYISQSREQVKTRAILLLIDGAYHIKARQRASEEFAAKIEELGIVFKDPNYPLISSTKPRVLTTGAEVKEELIAQIPREVNIPEVAALWEELGIEVAADMGPGQFVNQVIKRSYRGNLLVISVDDQKTTAEKQSLALQALKLPY